MTAMIQIKQEHLVTIPSLHKQGIAFSAEALMPWLPPGHSTALEHYKQRVQALIYATNHAFEKRGKVWQPKGAQLKLALIALTSMGLDLNPTTAECCLLSFMDKKTGRHDVTPYVMRNGYQRIAADIWPILGDKAVIALQGDEWLYEDKHSGTEWLHREATEHRDTKASTALALSHLIIGAGGRILFDGRREHAHVVTARRMREKVLANKNASRYPTDVWKSSPLAMLEKMVLVETYKSLPLRGRPAAAMLLAQKAESRQLQPLQEHLLMDGVERGLPTESTDDIEAIDVEPTIEPEVMSDGFEFPEETP